MDSIERVYQLVDELTRLPGVSGMEQAVVRVLIEKFKPFADEVSVDAFGNIVAERRGPDDAPRLMIAAHSDEVGGVVTALLPDGFLRFQITGVINSIVLPATRVRVAGKFIGTVGGGPAYINSQDPSTSEAGADHLHIDIGACDEDQLREWGVSVGSSVVFESPLVAFDGTTRVMGKALDNRIGCAALIRLFEDISGKEPAVTLFGVVNVLEEIGMRGARMTTAKLNPDYAIALDTVPTDDTPMSNRSDTRFTIGGGPVIQLVEGVADAYLGTVSHPAVSKLIMQTAKEESIAVQLSAAYGLWTTDGAAIHTSGEGIPTGFVSIPRRYAHTPNEILDLNDALDAIALLKSIVLKTGAQFVPTFDAWDD